MCSPALTGWWPEVDEENGLHMPEARWRFFLQQRRRRDGADGSHTDSLLIKLHGPTRKYFKHMNSVASNIRLHQQAQPTEDNRLEIFIQVWYLKGEL